MHYNLKTLSKKNLFLISLVIIGVLIKFYSFNNEDLWWDELLSFWASDPSYTFFETFKRNLEVNDGSQLIFTYLLKVYFAIFGYDPNISRLLTIFFGILSIPCLFILTNKLKIKNTLPLLLFLFLFNSYLLSYDHELRSYSFAIFISLLNFIFFINLINKKRNIDFILVSLINLIGVLNHTFFILISFSQFIFLIINNRFDKIFIKYILFHIFVIFIFYVISKESLSTQINIDEFWIPSVSLGFLVDFFFSRFFSSKILGSIYLITFIYLIYKNKKLFFKYNSFYFYLLILISTSYFIPYLYGLIKIPVLTDRYILFIIVPILILISSGINNLNNKKLQNIIIIVIALSTFSDTLFRIFKNDITKPEFKKAINYIENSSTNIILINNEHNFKIIQNYLIKLNPSLNIVNKITDNEKKLWKLCYLPSTSFSCDIQEDENKLLQLKTEDFNLIIIKLYRNM